MKNLDNVVDDSDIKERILKEETKAQLAAAREGMEREAARLKEQKQETTTPQSNRFGNAAASMGGSTWLTPHRRGGATSLPGAGQKLDTQSEELFPDLASADKILERKEKAQQPIYKAPKKTPVGGGATWATKAPVKAATMAEASGETPSSQSRAGEAASTPTPIITSGAPVKKAVSKKKKKDLSAFKPTG